MKSLVLAGLLAIGPSGFLQAQEKAHHVLFAVSSPDAAEWQLAMRNIQALETGLAPEPLEVEVLAFGPGVGFMKSNGPEADLIRKLASPHVRFVACRNAMAAQHLTAADLAPGVTVVPFGIVELVRRQEQGWAYVKAGY